MTTSKIKVCFIVGTLGRGGAEKQLLYMLKALKNAFVETRVLCLTKGEAYEEQIKSLGVPIEWVGESSNRLVRLLTIIKKLRGNSTDILQSSHFYTNIYAGLAGKILKIPSIGAIRNDLLSELRSHKRLGKWQISLPKILIANSRRACEHTVETGISPEKIIFVQNVVDSIRIESEQIPDSKSVLKIIFVGRLVNQKRPERFIKLASVLINKFPNISFKFQIAGDGVLRNELEELAKNLNLSSENLEFAGVQSNIYEIYKEADILISTSEHEGTSNVILEAMSFGIPVIATKVGGTPEILDETRGVLIEPGNEEQLIEAATKLILDAKLRKHLGKEGKRYIENNHSLKSLQKQLIKVYENLIK